MTRLMIILSQSLTQPIEFRLTDWPHLALALALPTDFQLSITFMIEESIERLSK